MQTATQTIAAPAASERDQILDLLETFINSRPGLEFANYGDVSAYRSESRAITRDRDQALTLLRYVRWNRSIDATALREAFRDAYSGRLSLDTDAKGRLRLSYCAGQYYPTEYRKAACAVLASAIWDYWRDHCMPKPFKVYGTNHDWHAWKASPTDLPKPMRAGDWLRAKARAEFGPTIARRWFN